ncbi:MAG: PAS domain S-box protein, partial [Methanomicrobiales archaeon]|nr:PAS domain S-box protein [Methanomicrobiales archaeon]
MTGDNDIRCNEIGGAGELPGREICPSLLREAPDGFALMDGEGRCRYLNLAFTRITGYTGGDIPSIAVWFERAHPNPAYRREVQEMWEELLRGDRGSVVAGVVCRDGRVRDIEIRQTPIGEMYNLYVIRDVTEHVATEELLKQTTSELTAVIEAFPDQFLRLNIDGTIIESRTGRHG